MAGMSKLGLGKKGDDFFTAALCIVTRPAEMVMVDGIEMSEDVYLAQLGEAFHAEVHQINDLAHAETEAAEAEGRAPHMLGFTEQLTVAHDAFIDKVLSTPRGQHVLKHAREKDGVNAISQLLQGLFGANGPLKGRQVQAFAGGPGGLVPIQLPSPEEDDEAPIQIPTHKHA